LLLFKFGYSGRSILTLNMKKRFLITILFLGLIHQNSFSQSAICSYKYRKRITFDPSKVSGSSDLLNFPALISITSDNDLRSVSNSGHVENSNGYDIVFTSDDGVTLLKFQMEKYTATNGKYTAWVKIPVLSTSLDTYIYMYYGNTSISTDQSSTAVWSNYHGVWHMENNNFSDSSPGGYNLTNNGTTNQSPAEINDGRADNGSQWTEVANTFPNITSDFSISGWFYTTDKTTGGQRIFCDDENNNGGYGLSIGDNSNSGMVRFFSRGSTPEVLDSPTNIISNNTWQYISSVADVTNLVKKIYVNGVQVASGSFTGWGTDSGIPAIAGETASGFAIETPVSGSTYRLSGRIDEVRVAKSTLSADWFVTEYNNQSAPSSFYAISSEPKVWTGGTSTTFNTNSNWLGNSSAGNGDDVIINNGTNQPTLSGNIQIISVFIKTGATLSLSNRNLSVRADITNCGVITGNTGMVTFNSGGGGTNFQNQYFSGSGTNNLNDLTINNTFATSPAVILNKDVNVSGALALTSGIVYTDISNILALGTGATSTSGSASSFVSGPMSKAGNTNFVFPTGKGTRWRRAALANISSTSTFVAEYFNSAYTSTSPVNTPLNNISKIEYWQMNRSAGTGSANLSLYWESASGSGIDNCPDLTIARWNGSGWDERAGTAVGSCSGTGTGIVTTSTALTSFSPFTFGSKSGTLNPLPIELVDFKAACGTGKVVLNWKTASETRNDHFTLERSNDGFTWTNITQLDGALSSSSTREYSFVDDYFTNGVIYYRLSQGDSDGIIKRVGLITADCLAEQEQVLMYPNPATNELTVEFNLKQSYGNVTLKIIDALGRVSLQHDVLLSGGKSLYNISLDLTPGVYNVLVFSKQLVLPARKLIVKSSGY
jgi:hypothetical protein